MHAFVTDPAPDSEPWPPMYLREALCDVHWEIPVGLCGKTDDLKDHRKMNLLNGTKNNGGKFALSVTAITNAVDKKRRSGELLGVYFRAEALFEVIKYGIEEYNWSAEAGATWVVLRSKDDTSSLAMPKVDGTPSAVSPDNWMVKVF